MTLATAGSAAVFDVSGLSAGTLVFEARVRDSWKAAEAFPWPVNLSAGSATSTTANGIFWSPNEGDVEKRARLATAGGDTVTVTLLPAPTDVPVPAAVTIGSTTVSVGSVSINAATSGGWTPHGIIWPGNTTGQTIKVGAGQLGYLAGGNSDTIDCWCQVYDLGGVPTIGTSSASLKHTLYLPAQGGNNITFTPGVAFASGIAVIVHAGANASDTVAPTASKVTLNLGTK